MTPRRLLTVWYWSTLLAAGLIPLGGYLWYVGPRLYGGVLLGCALALSGLALAAWRRYRW